VPGIVLIPVIVLKTRKSIKRPQFLGGTWEGHREHGSKKGKIVVTDKMNFVRYWLWLTKPQICRDQKQNDWHWKAPKKPGYEA